jgi:hypothetical protein
MASRSPLVTSACFAALLTALLRSCSAPAFAPAARVTRGSSVVRAAYDSGKVNLGVEIKPDASPPPQPVLECDEGCVTAIHDCLDEGCSVDAIMQLDSKLAEDENEVATSILALESKQKTSYSEGNAALLYWLRSFLGKTEALRAQLHALRPLEDPSSLMGQMAKAVSVAFGGGRATDYPKVGVLSYSN